MVLCRPFHTTPEQGHNVLRTHFQVLKLSGGVYFNGFQVSSFGRRHGQYEWFLHNIGPNLSPGLGHSQCDYTITMSK